ncbi:DUF5302 domain-containing protein [Xylanimonas protaetiae]|uniref:DUF5302 domain-containing protein n=1 Tax=Xylanimonas protaetiae TaxID=2509457 RepID=A0A4P6F6T1_9MICO|nr:DUF5302 domain-containing protein [Xylanimonas protaetiae]QAY71364.1 hypothetical protein ET471_16100 [Xylanimonas protaetiae]
MPSADNPDAKAAASEDAKARFRAALEKKNAAQHRHNDGQRNTGTVHGSETTGPAGQKMFRRKSG